MLHNICRKRLISEKINIHKKKYNIIYIKYVFRTDNHNIRLTYNTISTYYIVLRLIVKTPHKIYLYEFDLY